MNAHIAFAICAIAIASVAQGVLPLGAEENLDAEVERLLAAKPAAEESEAGKSSDVVDRASMPHLFIAVDMLGGKDFTAKRNSPDALTPNGFCVRSAEIGFFGGIDYLALGTVNVAVHQEEGNYFVELHEAFFEFNALPFNLYAKLGRFFPDIGRLNSIHQHDWHFATTPLVHQKLFDEEGIVDQGVEISLLMPWNFYQELKVGFFNGTAWGHAHSDVLTKPEPLFTARLKQFIPIVGELGTQFGGTYIRYVVDEGGNIDHTAGIDITAKWNKGKLRSVVFTTEYWYRYEVRPEAVRNNKKHGLYSYVQYQFHHLWFAGTRFDYFAELDVQTAAGNRMNRNSMAQSLWLTFRPSEFSYFRFSFERRDEFGTNVRYAAYIQADFILGYHPAHRY